MAPSPTSRTTRTACPARRVAGRAAAALDKARQLAVGLPAGTRECALIDIARDRATRALAAKDRPGAFAQLAAATAPLDALREAVPTCARFERFDITIDRAIATPRATRDTVVDRAKAIAAELRTAGVEPSMSQAIDSRIDEATRAP